MLRSFYHIRSNIPNAGVGGFNLHAGVVIGAHNREGLKRLCRYVARPPLSSKRLHIQPNGQILIRLKRAWMDGRVFNVVNTCRYGPW